ncbi:MFS transporter [Phenylobacterium sp. LjRoot219]|uniref:MFS transporter n=1 Tax=Phenylobacterium sp. LjRoot219 TaxID=3342283 RepID=UPI003ECD3A34
MKRGLRTLTVEAVFSSTCDAIMAGTIMTAFALYLGARPAQVGILTAIAFWGQLLQGPAVLLVERLRTRKRIAVVGSLISALAPAVVAALAFSDATPAARYAVAAAVGLYCGASAFAGCAWNAWTRDLVADDIRGRFTARRSRLAIFAKVVISLLAALALDVAGAQRDSSAVVFAGLFILAFVAQLLSAMTLARAPEPTMPPAPPKPARLVELLRGPLHDASFRPLVRFTASWQFAVNLAQPFFTVFLLQQLGFTVTFVMVLTIVSQLANLWALKRWGPLADRYGAKSVLNVAAPTYIVCIAAMIGASQLGANWLGVVYLVVVHLVMGVSGAGVTLGSASIALDLSPAGAAAPYLALNALISSAVAGVAPVLGGLGAEFFEARRVALVLEWAGPRIRGDLLGVHLTGWDFYFLFSALWGLYALHRLTLVRVEGEVPRSEMVQQILAQARARFARPPAVGAADPPEEVSADLMAAENEPSPSKSVVG